MSARAASATQVRLRTGGNKFAAYDAIVIGSGPNGFSSAITLARRGHSVLVVEGQDTIGGGLRTRELTLPGFRHDVCATVLAMTTLSPFMRSVDWGEYGVEWAVPHYPLAHPLDGGRAAVQTTNVAGTVNRLGQDGAGWERMLGPLDAHTPALMEDLLGPLPFPPKHPMLMAQFGVRAAFSAQLTARTLFRSEEARALFLGHAAHSILPLTKPFTSAVGSLLAASAHCTGWPVARGGSQKLGDAMARCFTDLGGEIVTGWQVEHIDELPRAKAYLFDTSPYALARIAASRLPAAFCDRLNAYRFGPGAFKLDLALSDPIPWAAEECRSAGTVHVCGGPDEIVASEAAAWSQAPTEKPFVLVVQPTVFDPSRAPEGKHTCWAYCHVPNNATIDMAEPILAQIERFAPGFRDTILATHTISPGAFQGYNPNYVGGDIIGGVQDLGQMFTRPVARWNPYTTPARDLYICSASTPPGAGIHGMCGYFAAQAALRQILR
ncbi:MAG: NAD(P)/FAD-dependent oxidoreductase [Verrucomicrobiae bacterium]|nr:NAD(P)/FAD-dependent oxidoreductase [Verrucomicrobiae bacterium]